MKSMLKPNPSLQLKQLASLNGDLCGSSLNRLKSWNEGRRRRELPCGFFDSGIRRVSFERGLYSTRFSSIRAGVSDVSHVENENRSTLELERISSNLNPKGSSLPPSADEPVLDTPRDVLLSEICEGLAPIWLLERLNKLGYTKATRTQIESLPAIFSNSDVVLHAQTGSGKTLSFLIPLISIIDSKQKCVQALIIVPSRELGIQITRVIRQLVGQGESSLKEETSSEDEGEENDCSVESHVDTKRNEKLKLTVMALLDGGNSKRQKIWLQADPPHIVVGNADQILKFVVSKSLRLAKTKVLVVDEVDEVIKRSKFSGSGSLQKLFAFLPPPEKRKTIFSSATFSQHNRFVKECVEKKWTKKDLIHAHVEKNNKISPFIHHKHIVCEKEEKLNLLLYSIWVDNPRSAIIFTNQQSAKDKSEGKPWMAETIAEHFSKNIPTLSSSLSSSSIAAQSTNSDPTPSHILTRFSNPCGILIEKDSIQKRTAALQAFRNADVGILIATDLACRGLDIPDVSHIYNFDLPMDDDVETYVHRAGRTARRPIQQEIGCVTTMVSPKQVFALRKMENALGISIQERNLEARNADEGDRP